MVILSFFIISSGCIKNTNENNNIIDQDINSLVMVKDLPEGYEFLGPFPNFSDYNNDYENIINSGEGIYRDVNNSDVYLDILEFDSDSNALIFINEYKARKQSTTDSIQFDILTINGHSVTRIKTYSTSKGHLEPRYSFIWTDNKYVYIVKSNSNDENSALNIVKAII